VVHIYIYLASFNSKTEAFPRFTAASEILASKCLFFRNNPASLAQQEFEGALSRVQVSILCAPVSARKVFGQTFSPELWANFYPKIIIFAI
jgi:hypothetical protein